MNNANNLSENLKTLKGLRQLSLTEFAKELGIPRATLQSVMKDGQTTLDTACRIAEGAGVPISTLLEDPLGAEKTNVLAGLLQSFDWYSRLDADRKSKAMQGILLILEVLRS